MTGEQRRFKPLAESEMSEAQRKVYGEIAGGPRGGVRGPFNALLRSPELADRAQKLGEWVRYKSSLPEALKEFAILITARHWSAQYEWHAHHAHAMKAGLDPRLAAELAQGRRPSGMSDQEAAVHDFCKELHEKKSVSDANYARAVRHFGETGAVELIGVIGYYTLVSMILNVDRVPIPGGAPLPLPPLTRTAA
jgi:4-carboxymuconolactone decarboxylase